MLDGVGISERRACRLVRLSRTSYREPPKADEQTATLSARIVELAHERRRFGYRRIHDLLVREGHAVNHKRVWRLYRQNNLAVRLNAEIKRRTNVVGIFPNDASITRLVGAMMLEQNDEWSLNRRYMQLEGLQTLCDTVPTRLSAVAR
jgi:hypothetical protein